MKIDWLDRWLMYTGVGDIDRGGGGGELPKVTLTYMPGLNGVISGSSPQIVDDGGSGTEIAAVPNDDYHFTIWSDGVKTATRTDTNVHISINVIAYFAPAGRENVLSFLGTLQAMLKRIFLTKT